MGTKHVIYHRPTSAYFIYRGDLTYLQQSLGQRTCTATCTDDDNICGPLQRIVSILLRPMATFNYIDQQICKEMTNTLNFGEQINDFEVFSFLWFNLDWVNLIGNLQTNPDLG